MCGRCFCRLEADDLSKACNYKDSTGKFKQVPWIYPNKKNDYKPSTNIGPRDYLPVIVSGKHFNSEECRVLTPMLWGMVPDKFMNNPTKHTLSTHNAKLETLDKTMFRVPLMQGCRCILIIEGIYEWKLDINKKKSPFCIYKKQEKGFKLEEPSSWKNNLKNWNEEEGWQGINIIKLAGLFQKMKNVKTNETLYSFTVITRESNDVLSWLHHRMPVFLNNQEEEEAWLNFSKFHRLEVLSWISNLKLSKDSITWHPVSTSVNNIRNKQSDLLKPSKLENNEKSQQFLSSWLKGKTENTVEKRKSDAVNDNESDPQKKLKKC